MCDTLVALANSTVDGSVIFAKNSDRQPNEPQIMVRIPRKTYQQGTKLKCTYIEIDQLTETYEVFLLKPSWIWGCEMGANEFGVNIGNEAVFTKEKYAKSGLIGMDLVRLALERAKNSEEALNVIIDLLSEYGQGGNCGYEKPFTYHNSFLIADQSSAWVLETAGDYWAAQKVKDVRSISNCLTIERDFDLCHPDLVKHAVVKGWCKDENDFSFSRCYSDVIVTRFSGSRHRCDTTTTFLQEHRGSISVANTISLLRSHDTKTEGRQFTKHSLKSVCMHGGFIFGDHTTCSYVASLNNNKNTYWVTGSSTPCIAVFKPLWLVDEEPITFSESDQAGAVDYWQMRERLHRMFLENTVIDPAAFLIARDKLETELYQKVAKLDLINVCREDLLEIMKYALEAEERLIKKTIADSTGKRPVITGNIYYKYYWHRQNKRLASKKQMLFPPVE